MRLFLFFYMALLSYSFIYANVNTNKNQQADLLLKLSNMVYSQAVEPNWIGDSHFFWYKNKEREGNVYYLVNAETGDKECAVSLEELTKKFPDQQIKASRLTNAVHTHKLSSGEAISPDEKWIAFIRDCNVYIRSTNHSLSSKIVQLSYNGTPGYAYSTNFQWSPDSKKLATLQVRHAEARIIPLLESMPQNQTQPILHWKKYPKPGDVVPVSLPTLFDVAEQKQIQLNTHFYENQFELTLTGWRENSRAFTFEFNQRGHQRFIVGEVNSSNGAITHLIDEKMNTFIDYARRYRYDIEDGKEIFWISERDGWRHLYCIDGITGGIKRQITTGEWIVRKVDFVDIPHRMIYFTASGFNKKEDPYNLHYCRINFDGKDFKDLTPENGNHHVHFSKDRQYFVDIYSRPDLPPVSVLRRGTTGELITTLEKCDITELEKNGWQMPEVFHAKGRDGKTDIWGTIYRPLHFDPSKSYPVIEDIYAGPHDSHVRKDFLAIEKFIGPLAEEGFIIVKIDGMGTNNRSKAFHDVCWKNIKDAGFPDRIRWIQAAAQRYKQIDISKVGIYGWSAGGQNAMGALLFYNDFYKVAVSLCGCHDNRVDKIDWNEKWMGYPIDESYSRSSNVDNAHLLKGDLLLINGELDDNVDPASTMQVVDALIKADKPFEQLYMPGKGHSLGGNYEMQRLRDFFVKHLLKRERTEQY